MEDQENEQQNQEQSVGQQLAGVGKEIGKDAGKKVLKAGAKKAGAFIIAHLPVILGVLVGIIILVVIIGGFAVIRDKINEIARNARSSISTFLGIGDNGPLAPNAQEMIELINQQLEEDGIDKESLGLGSNFSLLGSNSQVDNYLYKFMATSLSTQLPYIKDSTAETLKDIAINNPVTNPTGNLLNLNEKKDVQGIVKIKRQTGDKTKDLTFIKHEKFEELINNNDTKAIDYFSVNDEWMLCIAKTTKITTYNPDGTITENKKVTEETVPYQTMISNYSVPFEFFIALQQATQNAEYVSAVADLIQDGEIELTIFDSIQIKTNEYTYRYTVKTKWQEYVQKQAYINTRQYAQILTRANIARVEATVTEFGGGSSSSSESSSGKAPSKGNNSNSSKNPNKDSNTGTSTTPNKGQNSNPDKNEGGNATPDKGQNSNPDKNEGGSGAPDKGHNSNPDKNEGGSATPNKGQNSNLDKNEDGSGTTDNGNNSHTDENEEPEENDTPNESNESQEPEMEWQVKTSEGEEQHEITITVSEINEITVDITKANVWVIDVVKNYTNHSDPEEYPLGEKEITTELKDEDEPTLNSREDKKSWKINRSETIKETVQKEGWEVATSNIDIDESKFLGLWKTSNPIAYANLGVYISGTSYSYDPNGIVLKYKLPNSLLITESPLENLSSNEEWLYSDLEKSENTQIHAQLMRYLIAYYKDPDKAVKPDLSIFDTKAFTEINWNKYGSGYWWPLQDITQTRITSQFGPRGAIVGTTHTSTHFHSGIDIGVPIGSEVIATADGTVEIAGSSESAGNWIRINHSNGIKTVYMHNSVLLVNVGQEVKQGDVIALSGNTGNSNGPHLHFGVLLNGEYVNPLDYVSTENPRPTNVVPDVPANVEAWTPYIIQAFEELGYECTDEKVGAILRQIATESSGNQYIIQGITDSNSGKPINIGNGICPWCETLEGASCRNTNIGHGLLQFIPTTFYANMIPGHTNIFNGYDQIITCITMLERRSGSYTDYIGKGTGWG